MSAAARARAGGWAPALLIAAGLAAAVLYNLRELLVAGFDRLPGTDAGNLYSWEIFTRSVLSEWRLPHWNAYQFGGTPHLADNQTTVFYPPALLLRWLPPLAFLPWMAALHIWIGGIGALVLARVVGLGWVPSAAAALGVTLGGSVAPWVSNGHLLLVYCAAWLPWALAFAILSVRRPTVWPHPMLVVVLLLQFLAGYLQGSVYVTAAVCLYFAYSIAWPERGQTGVARWRPAGQLAIAGALTLGLSAFQLLPTARLASEAARTSGLTFDAASRGGWTAADLRTFFSPFAGIEGDVPHRWMADRTAYIGWLLVGLVPLSLLDRERRRVAVFLAVLAGAAIVLAFGANLPFYRLHYALFPGFRLPGRVLFLATVALAVLGGLGLERVLRLASAWRTRLAPVVATAAVILIGVDLQAFWSGAVQTSPAPDVGAVRQWLGPPRPGRVLSLCENRIGPHELLIDRRPTFDGVGGVFLRGLSDWQSLAAIEGSLPVRRDLLDAANVTTVVACNELEAPSLTAVSHVGPVFVYRNDTAWPRVVWTCAAPELSRAEVLEQLRVGRYDANRRLVRGYLVNVRWTAGLPEEQREALERRYRLHEPEHREGATWRYRVDDLTGAEIAALLAEPAVEDTHGLDRRTGELLDRPVAVEDDAPGGVVIGTGACDASGSTEVAIVEGPGDVVAADVAAPAPGVLFFVEPYFPERRAFVDGVEVPVMRANAAFTAVNVGAGPHRVELRYVPSSLRAGSAVSVSTAGLWALAAIGRRRHRRRSGRPRGAAEPLVRP